jgi:hypothetical protein
MVDGQVGKGSENQPVGVYTGVVDPGKIDICEADFTGIAVEETLIRGNQRGEDAPQARR